MRQLPTLQQLVGEGQQVHFQHYMMGQLWYKVDGDYGFEFSVPIEETGFGVYNRDTSAVSFTQYIKRYRDMLELEIALEQV